MRSRNVSIVCASLAFAATMFGCEGNGAPKTPLGTASVEASTGGVAVSPIGGEAKVALDSANMLFRAKNYAAALAQYNRSAELAPSEIAPLLGIMMVADVTQDAKLASETRPRIRKLNPAVADSSPAMSHSKIIDAHPPAGGGKAPSN